MLIYIYPTLHSWFVLLIFIGEETLIMNFHDPQYAVILYDMLTHLFTACASHVYNISSIQHTTHTKENLVSYLQLHSIGVPVHSSNTEWPICLGQTTGGYATTCHTMHAQTACRINGHAKCTIIKYTLWYVSIFTSRTCTARYV